MKRPVIAATLLVAVLFIGWHVATSVAEGIGQLFGDAGNVGTSNVPPGIQLQQVYVVAPGDTLNGIASRFGVSPKEIIGRNHIAHPNSIYAGQKLYVPAPYNPRGTREMIIAAAHRFGVNPNFALGLAWQESGFDENVISPTNAIGVMQVEPDTARLVAADLGRSFDLGVAKDNISVGVYWLAYLTRTYHGNERSAAAAYYEGMGNLAQHGYLNGTQQYVSNVMALKHAFATGNPPG